MSNPINLDRRRFFGLAAMTAAAVGMTGKAFAGAVTPTPAHLPTVKRGTHITFAAL